jgi:hypothetical protein
MSAGRIGVSESFQATSNILIETFSSNLDGMLDPTPAARSRVAQILEVLPDTASVAKAMEAASIRPDTEFREEDRTTAPWHYIDICLQDSERDLPARCRNRDCVTAKIDEYEHRLRDGDYDTWGAAGDLAFLIHFVRRHSSACPYHDQR